LKITEGGGNLEFFIHSSGTWHNVTAKLPDDASSQFHTYAGVYDGSRLVIFIDGKEAASKPCNSPVAKNGFELAVGIDTEETARRLNGVVRKAAVYDRALTAAELSGDAGKALLQLDFLKDAAKPTDEEPILVYGGDFNERPTDGSFSCNGLVTSDMQPTPQFEEVKKVYQEVHTTAEDVSTPVAKLRIRNESFFRDTSYLTGSWKLLENGVAVGEGKLGAPVITPRESAVVEVPTNVTPKGTSEYILRVRYDLTARTAWHPAGMPVSWDEIPLPWGKRSETTPTAPDSNAAFTEDRDRVTVRVKDVTAVVSKVKGDLVSLKVGDVEWLHSPLHLNFWRPPTNNDEGAKLQHKLKVWQYAGIRAKAEKTTVTQESNDVLVTAEISVPAGKSSATVQYRFHGSGQISIATEFRPDKSMPAIPRIGFQAEIPERTQLWRWHGRGPHENYADRKSGAWTTIHEGAIAQLFSRYPDPQESGNRTEIRWATLASWQGGSNLRIDATGGHLLEMACYPCAARDIELAMHPSELPVREYVTVNLDHQQSGI
ncbi:MAG: DUF4981 domain-containing protein, partial [Verrucomicrobiaceae bacterium]